MIVITSPTLVTNEIEIIHALFEEGLQLLHIRKPDYSEEEMKIFLSEIKKDFRQQLVLHSHHQQASAFGINRIHFTEKERYEATEESLKNWKKNGFKLSTSIHQMIDFEELSNEFDYAFFGPVFESISKLNYISNLDFKTELKHKKNSVKLVAIGGITSKNIKTALGYGFDNVALLGTIWNSNHAIENFKLCQQIVLTY
ncbi:thiamine phosphate synthase [Flavobacterium sp. 5]|uniref:thiamine phosphate synthase n=1 Tax=Flavobacterium sp. 5 TaxID=2035199 RepID=UPI000C2B8894|nr:thiamine phosphate synthase [Flavobacterium sp. 5]PKB16237.1 thiamine-phosphate pyrophosphorylase [Flavobacterium sp. 5]